MTLQTAENGRAIVYDCSATPSQMFFPNFNGCGLHITFLKRMLEFFNIRGNVYEMLEESASRVYLFCHSSCEKCFSLFHSTMLDSVRIYMDFSEFLGEMEEVALSASSTYEIT